MIIIYYFVLKQITNITINVEMWRLPLKYGGSGQKTGTEGAQYYNVTFLEHAFPVAFIQQDGA